MGHISFLIEMDPLIQTLKGQSQMSVLDGCRCYRSHDCDGIFRDTNQIYFKSKPSQLVIASHCGACSEKCVWQMCRMLFMKSKAGTNTTRK